MLDILRSIKKIIEKFIVNKTALTSNVAEGDTSISIESTRRFCIGDPVVIFTESPINAQTEGEVHVVENIPNFTTIEIDTPLVRGYTTDGFVEKMIGFETGHESFLDAVYIGEPNVILQFPAITVNGVSRNSEWMTLESTKESYTIEITVYVTGPDQEAKQEQMYTWVRAIENSLFRSFYPLVEPFRETTLLGDIQPDDSLIRVDDPDFFICTMGWIFIESHDFLRENMIIRDLGQGVYQLAHAIGKEFDAGDKVIAPGRHIFMTLPVSTQYGTVNKEGALIDAARITYECSEEVKRWTPFLDPLTL